MKKILLVLAILAVGTAVPAQSNAPSSLAIVPETPDAGTAVDVLTAELTQNSQVHLLERAEIDRVYHEQGLSAANRDDLKLGRLLGADGLLLLGTSQEGTNQFLNIRLVAVKPGVVLVAERFPWPIKDITGWSPLFAKRLDVFLPKLAVLAKDAIPISVVNLRSAIQSDEGRETEQQLKLLTIQRLSREPQLFVLERQRMELLGEEKELKSDESAFWDGSYLLEGVVDQNGYSKDTVTINGRLTPPKGGAPVLFEVSGSRTNPAEVINALAAKVDEALKVNSSVKSWDAADEAAQYFKEAQWAMRWGIYPEAQGAVESAWALGKRDLECAELRVSAYKDALPEVVPPGMRKFSRQPGYRYVNIDAPPDPHDCDLAILALQCYYEFSRNSPDGEPKVLSRGPGWNDWHNSDWYQLGVDTLVTASQVLQHYNFNPQSQPSVADKLADLRALARSVAALISQSPSVHDSYFVGDRVATRDELVHTMGEEGGKNPSIFVCEATWACYWQETPEDEIALYRELMSSPVFAYIHEKLWFRSLEHPRLVAWNETDRKRLAQVWDAFSREMDTSTNVIMKMEGKAIKLREATKLRGTLGEPDAIDEKEGAIAITNFFETLIENRCAFVTNQIDWDFSDLITAIGADRDEMGSIEYTETPQRTRLEKICSDYAVKLRAKDDESAKILADQQHALLFERQIQYLKANKPFVPNEFVQMFIFGFKDYSHAQAVEILPLLAAYKTNLTGTWAPIGAMQVGQVEENVNRILNPPAPSPRPPAQAMAPGAVVESPPTAPSRAPVARTPNQAPEIPTNVITVSRFFPIPLDGLPGDQISSVTITAHHWLEGKLLLDFQYGAFIYSFDEKGNWQDTRTATLPAIALLDPATERWKVVSCPEVDIGSQNRFYHRTTLWRGGIFTSDGGRIRRFNEASNSWEILNIPEVGNCELFVVNDHLYAATPNLIAEILEGGTGMRILASNRRQPPVSALDTENLGTPALFAGPGQSLRAVAGNKIVAWVNEDWRTVCSAPQAPTPPAISGDGVLFRADGWNAPAGIWRLATDGDQVVLCLGQRPAQVAMGAAGSSPDDNSKPMWKLPPGFSTPPLSAASRGSDVYLMADHAKSQEITDENHILIRTDALPQDGYHAELLCFSSNYPAPQKLFLKFDHEGANPPVTGDNGPMAFTPVNQTLSWLLFSSNALFCGQETVHATSSSGNRRSGQPQTGVWMIPVNEIDSEIARQRKNQQEGQVLSEAQAKQAAQDLLAKYDRNHNGIIDPEEREEALDDPAFIESELDKIDANHNGILDPEELAYFDANQSKVLDPKKQAGIEIAQHLLAERIMKQFDVNGEGSLDRAEFSDYWRSTGESSMGMPGFQPFPDRNHDGRVDLMELESFLKRQTLRKLQSASMQLAFRQGQQPTLQGQPLFHNPTGTNDSVDQQQQFKAAVEAYWHNSDDRSAGGQKAGTMNGTANP